MIEIPTQQCPSWAHNILGVRAYEVSIIWVTQLKSLNRILKLDMKQKKISVNALISDNKFKAFLKEESSSQVLEVKYFTVNI